MFLGHPDVSVSSGLAVGDQERFGGINGAPKSVLFQEIKIKIH